MMPEKDGRPYYERVNARDVKIIYEKGENRTETLVRVFPASEIVDKRTSSPSIVSSEKKAID